MSLSDKQQIGHSAEQKARLFLQTKGFRFIEQNYTCRYGEIDLIMSDKDDIVFVEVRSRSRVDFGHPAETINASKQAKLIKTATHFLQKKEWLYKVSSRFDIVALQLVADKWELDWIKNAFWARY